MLINLGLTLPEEDASYHVGVNLGLTLPEEDTLYHVGVNLGLTLPGEDASYQESRIDFTREGGLISGWC